jgi:hypothetical protein
VAGPLILAGVAVADEANWVTPYLFDGTDEWVCAFGETETVNQSATADGMQIRAGTAGGGPGASCRLLCANSSGTILGSTASFELAASQWVEADFSSSFSVTLNDEVQLWFCMEGTEYYNIQTDGATWVANTDNSGSFDTPPATMNSSASNFGGSRPALRLMGTAGGASTSDVNFNATNRGVARGVLRGVG